MGVNRSNDSCLWQFDPKAERDRFIDCCAVCSFILWMMKSDLIYSFKRHKQILDFNRKMLFFPGRRQCRSRVQLHKLQGFFRVVLLLITYFIFILCL